MELLLISSWVKDSNEGRVLTTRIGVDTTPDLEGARECIGFYTSIIVHQKPFHPSHVLFFAIECLWSVSCDG